MTNNPLQFFIDRTSTPIGELMLAADTEGRLCAIDWTDYEPRMQRLLERYYGTGGFILEPKRNPGGLTAMMEKYFAGDLAVVQELPVRVTGTPFQQSVWNALREIPCGTTTSYGELARTIGRSAAVRAVGMANGSNPVGVVVPCHRVIGSNGSLTGYGGGLERKRWLLAHEGAITTQLSGLQPAREELLLS